MSQVHLRASLALIGDDLRAVRDVCVTVDGDGFVESVEGWGSCPWDSAGGMGRPPPPAGQRPRAQR
ncbi:hypothetical protein [Acidilobus saccharovorans]|uniref:hypothetical protein n=1 Tax=Acidilobus saccharovorans TaxID=242703 RepID=UPI0013053906|nr:hypothetical protein [Acidilobus saccharovorans]